MALTVPIWLLIQKSHPKRPRLLPSREAEGGEGAVWNAGGAWRVQQFSRSSNPEVSGRFLPRSFSLELDFSRWSPIPIG